MSNPAFQSMVKAKLANTDFARHVALSILIKTMKAPQMQALAQFHAVSARNIESAVRAEIQKELHHTFGRKDSAAVERLKELKDQGLTPHVTF